jgi:iron complex outermembrane receptor protein
MKSLHSILSACVAGALFFSIAPTATAQGVLEEIVVTAQKREQNIQDVGIAITAFTGDQMRSLGIEQRRHRPSHCSILNGSKS